MGAVMSLPCFLRRRRKCSNPHAPRSVASVKISHPRPLGSGLGTSVHGGGGSGMSAAGGSTRSIMSTRHSDRVTIRGGERSRPTVGFPGISIFDEEGPTAASSPGKANLSILPESDSEETQDGMHGTQEEHESFSSRTSTSHLAARRRARSTSSARGVGPTPLSWRAHRLPRDELTISVARPSGSSSEGPLRRRDGNSTSASTIPRTVPKRTSSYNHMIQMDSSLVSRPRPLSYLHDTDMLRSDSSRTFVDMSTHPRSTDPSLSVPRRRRLRKIRRVDNGWDYIRPTDLDGWREGLGRNGRRTSFAD